jgi:hypothetical protein
MSASSGIASTPLQWYSLAALSVGLWLYFVVLKRKEQGVMTRSQLKLLALLAFFAAPALAAWLSYAYLAAATAPLRRSAGAGAARPAGADRPGRQTRNWSELRGKWVLLVVNTADCDASCARATYLARQVRLAQGREQERIERVFLGPRAASDWPHRDGVYRAAPPQAAAVANRLAANRPVSGRPLGQPDAALPGYTRWRADDPRPAPTAASLADRLT